MKIAVIGATGKAGGMIAREAANRGHEVTAVIRPQSEHRLEGNYKVIKKDITELTPDDLRGFDAVVNAFGTPFNKPGSEYMHQSTMEGLVNIFKELPDVRLLVVGGASSLYLDREKKTRLLEDIPKDFRAVPENMLKAFDKLKESDINWTYFSPAKTFDPSGARTGKYMLGTDFVISNTSGQSYLSYADYAIAMIDEIENKAYVKRRFTAVSDSPFHQDEERLFNIGATPFIRRGGYFGVYSRPGSGDGYGSANLYLGSRRGGIACMPDNHLMHIFPTKNGKKVPYAVNTTATELVMQTRYGDITFCFAEKSLLLIKGTSGLGLKLERNMITHELFKKRGDKAWEGVFRWTCSLVFNPLQGEMDVNSPWDYEELCTPRARAEILPDENGEFLLSVEEFTHSGCVRDKYPTYAEALKNVKEDWEYFLQGIPHFVFPLEDKREETAYMLWSHLVDPLGNIKRPLMYMGGTFCASAWQMCQNAVALGSRDLDISIELLLNMFDHQSPQGQIPDLYDDMRGVFPYIKPPMQGWAIKWLMKTHDFGKEVPRDKLIMLYEGCAKWADWFMLYRDDDKDGIPQYEHSDETGFDDVSVFRKSNVMETPDLPAYLGLLFEALGDIAVILGKDKKEADEWYNRSKEIIDKLVKTMWNGERFIAHVSGTHEVVATDSFLYYLPIVLGKRLPQEIIDKLAEDLAIEGDLLTPYGLSCEKISTSDDFKLSGGIVMALGSVIPPSNLFIATGLYDAGKTELAKLISRRYCQAIKDGAITFTMNPFRGAFGGFGGSWPACAYIVLAGLCGN